jgi:hypothetical protein
VYRRQRLMPQANSKNSNISQLSEYFEHSSDICGIFWRPWTRRYDNIVDKSVVNEVTRLYKTLAPFSARFK